MPLCYEHYREGVFSCGLDERVNEADMRQWAQLAKQYADTKIYPIVALLDVREASYITAAARQILSKSSDQHFMHAVAVVASDFVVEQNMRLTALMSASKMIEVFTELQAAQDYANNHAQLVQGIRGEASDAL